MQILYVIRDLYPKYIKNSYNSLIKDKEPNLKLGKESE